MLNRAKYTHLSLGVLGLFFLDVSLSVIVFYVEESDVPARDTCLVLFFVFLLPVLRGSASLIIAFIVCDVHIDFQIVLRCVLFNYLLLNAFFSLS